MKKVLVIAAAVLFTAALADAKCPCAVKDSMACKAKMSDFKKDWKKGKRGEWRKFSWHKRGGWFKKEMQKCPKCNPWRKEEPCKPVIMVMPAPVPAPAPVPVPVRPARISQDEVSSVAAVRDTGTGQKIVFTTPILFETNSDQIKPESRATIQRMAVVLIRHPQAKTTVEGYTDNIGDPAYNVDLSNRRAHTVRDILVQEGVQADNVSFAGYGQANPVADNKTKEGRAQNRRVELDIKQ